MNMTKKLRPRRHRRHRLAVAFDGHVPVMRMERWKGDQRWAIDQKPVSSFLFLVKSFNDGWHAPVILDASS